jgi:hypothetical protein
MTTHQVSHIDTLTEYKAIEQESEELTLNTFNCAQSTALNRMFLSYCVAVHSEFSDLSGRFKKRQSAEYGWETSTANPYCRVGKFLGALPIENIELLDPNTLLAIAKERYQPIHEALEDERLTVADVRSLAKEINALNKKEKEPAKQIEWCGNPRQLKILMADGSGSMGFESDYKEMASAFQQHVNSDLPIELYIEQVNHVVKSNKQTIAEALGIKLVPPVLHCLADSGAQCPIPNTQSPISNTQSPTPNAQSPTPNDECIDLAVPTERYKKGWQVGQSVRVNTNAKNAIALREFARDRLLVIYQIIGNPADENQRVHLIREDGEILNLANFGSWLEDDFSLESRINADLMCEANFSPYKEVIELVKELKALQAQEAPKAKTAISKWQKSIEKKQREIDKFTEAETIWFDKPELEKNGRLIFVPGGKDFLCNEQSDVVEVQSENVAVSKPTEVIEVKNAAQAEKVLLLDEEVLEGNLDKYLGCAVEVCDSLGEIKYGGTLKRFDPNNYLLQIETATGNRVADLRCTWAVNSVATPC